MIAYKTESSTFCIFFNDWNFNWYLLRRNANYAAAVIASASSKITNFIDVFLSFVNVNDWDSANPLIVSLTVLIPLSSDALSY